MGGRGKSRWAAAVLALALATPAAAADPNPPAHVVTHPDWLAKPDGEAFAEHYPTLADALSVAGEAVLTCKVAVDGALADCRVTEESPKDFGFGQAVLAMANEFRMKPMSVDGQPVAGGEVSIPITFRPPDPEPVSLPPPPQTAQAREAALRLVDVMQAVDGSIAEYDRDAHLIETTADGSPGAARAEAAMEIRQAAANHRADLRDAYARAWASVFSEEQMAAIATFYDRFGKLMADPGLALDNQKIVAGSLALLRGSGHTAFCAKHDCGSAQAVRQVWRPQSGPGRIDDPQWVLAPDPDTLAAAGPELFEILGVTGAARLGCTAADDGTLKDCAVEAETPVGMGFGAAALRVTGVYRVGRVQLDAGGRGRRVTVRVGFAPPDAPPAFQAPNPPPAALAAARKAVAIARSGENTALQLELQVDGYKAKPPPGVDKGVYEDAITAYRAAAEAAQAAQVDQIARAWATRFTEAQLADIAGFVASPTGQAFIERGSALGVASQQAASAVGRDISADVRKAFCGSHDCGPSAEGPAAKAPAVKP